MPTSKKITERRLKEDQPYLPYPPYSSLDTMLGLMQALTQNNELDNEEFLSPQMRPDGRYVTSEANLDKWIDPRIFRETQVKRFLRWLTTDRLTSH